MVISHWSNYGYLNRDAHANVNFLFDTNLIVKFLVILSNLIMHLDL